jgi:hypothetical protein
MSVVELDMDDVLDSATGGIDLASTRSGSLAASVPPGADNRNVEATAPTHTDTRALP